MPELEGLDLGSRPTGRGSWIGCRRDVRRLARLRAFLDPLVTRLGN